MLVPAVPTAQKPHKLRVFGVFSHVNVPQHTSSNIEDLKHRLETYMLERYKLERYRLERYRLERYRLKRHRFER